MNSGGDAEPDHRRRSAPVVEVAAALIFHGNKVLITQRRAGSHLAGLWEFPGGKREPAESFEGCLVREIREELGVDIAVGDLFDTVSHAYPEKRVLLKFFICRLMRGEPQPLDCAALTWAGPEDLAAHTFPAADAQLLEKLGNSPALWQ